MLLSITAGPLAAGAAGLPGNIGGVGSLIPKVLLPEGIS